MRREAAPQFSYAEAYVAEPLYVDGEVALFPGDLAWEQLQRYQELFDNFMPVPPGSLAEYPDVESFIADERPENNTVGTLNFLGFFQEEESVAGLSHKQKPVFQRLRFLHPELVEELEYAVVGVESLRELKREDQTRLWAAHERMRSLVSVNDPDLRFECNDEGQIHSVAVCAPDRDYLKH